MNVCIPNEQARHFFHCQLNEMLCVWSTALLAIMKYCVNCYSKKQIFWSHEANPLCQPLQFWIFVWISRLPQRIITPRKLLFAFSIPRCLFHKIKYRICPQKHFHLHRRTFSPIRICCCCCVFHDLKHEKLEQNCRYFLINSNGKRCSIFEILFATCTITQFISFIDPLPLRAIGMKTSVKYIACRWKNMINSNSNSNLFLFVLSVNIHKEKISILFGEYCPSYLV